LLMLLLLLLLSLSLFFVLELAFSSFLRATC
jgi:hypothetical protein